MKSTPVPLHLLHDDGAEDITVMVHGLKGPFFGYNRDQAVRNVHRAELAGAVFLFEWNADAARVESLFDPFVINRATAAGVSLADMLVRAHRQASRPITLVAHSVGTVLMMATLTQLAVASVPVRNVVLMGGTASADPSCWENARVKRRFVNVYSTKDRCTGAFQGAIGSTPLGGSGVKNIKQAFGHGDYWLKLKQILKLAGVGRRSKSYHPLIEELCPWCEAELELPANTDVDCPACAVTFSFNLLRDRPEWDFQPRAIACPRCQFGVHAVQEAARYRCGDCNRWVDFDRVGHRIFQA